MLVGVRIEYKITWIRLWSLNSSQEVCLGLEKIRLQLLLMIVEEVIGLGHKIGWVVEL